MLVIVRSQLNDKVQLLIALDDVLKSVISPPKPEPQSLVATNDACAVGAGGVIVSTMVPMPVLVPRLAPSYSTG